jgi:hypothetical protein
MALMSSLLLTSPRIVLFTNLIPASNHTGTVTRLNLSGNARRVVSSDFGGGDHTLRVWHLGTLKRRIVFFWRGVSSVSLYWGNRSLRAGLNNGQELSFDIEILPLDPFLTTVHEEVVSEDLPASCGRRIPVPFSAVERIGHWVLQGGEGGYTDPALLMDCPCCGTPLRLNPFLVSTSPPAS